jgi:single-strand DNA-binding protein
MKNVNKVILLGRVGQDPEIRESGDLKIASFSMATSKSYKDKTTEEWVETTEWHNLTGFRNVANQVEKHVKKGSKVYIEGELKTEAYEKDGAKKYSTKIIINEISILDQVAKGDYVAPDGSSKSEDEDLPF